MDGVDLED